MRLHWNPFSNLDSVHREIDRVLEGFGLGPGSPLRYAFLPGRAARKYPLLNMHEGESAVTVEALAPGLDLDSLEVSVKGDTLTLSGRKKPLEGVAREAYHRNERSTGVFTRTLRLDSEIDSQKVSARYDGGILTVTLPKAERAKPRKIQVHVT